MKQSKMFFFEKKPKVFARFFQKAPLTYPFTLSAEAP